MLNGPPPNNRGNVPLEQLNHTRILMGAIGGGRILSSSQAIGKRNQTKTRQGRPHVDLEILLQVDRQPIEKIRKLPKALRHKVDLLKMCHLLWRRRRFAHAFKILRQQLFNCKKVKSVVSKLFAGALEDRSQSRYFGVRIHRSKPTDNPLDALLHRLSRKWLFDHVVQPKLLRCLNQLFVRASCDQNKPDLLSRWVLTQGTQ